MKPTTVLQLRSLYQAQARFRKGISVVPTDECTCGKAERLAQRFRTNRTEPQPVGFVGFPIPDTFRYRAGSGDLVGCEIYFCLLQHTGFWQSARSSSPPLPSFCKNHEPLFAS